MSVKLWNQQNCRGVRLTLYAIVLCRICSR